MKCTDHLVLLSVPNILGHSTLAKRSINSTKPCFQCILINVGFRRRKFNLKMLELYTFFIYNHQKLNKLVQAQKGNYYHDISLSH